MARIEKISAVLVTRGDHPDEMKEIVASLPFDDIVVWDNSIEPDKKVYGRHYAAMHLARHDTIYTQDDDCLCPASELASAYQGTMLVNVPEDEAPLTAWGAVYSKQSVVDAFARWSKRHPEVDDDFLLGADLIHALLTRWERMDLGRTDFPYAHHDDRMHRQNGYYEHRDRVASRARALARETL